MHNANMFCTACLLTGAVLPWVLLVAGGLLSFFAPGPVTGHIAAYMVAGALLLMIIGYLFRRVVSYVHSH